MSVANELFTAIAVEMCFFVSWCWYGWYCWQLSTQVCCQWQIWGPCQGI